MNSAVVISDDNTDNEEDSNNREKNDHCLGHRLNLLFVFRFVFRTRTREDYSSRTKNNQRTNNIHSEPPLLYS